MTNPPTDEELALICYSAPKGGHYLQDGHRALFTAGERRGIERAIEALRAAHRVHGSGYSFAICVLESLRDVPAVELKPECDVCRDKPSPGHGRCPACGADPYDKAPFDEAPFDDEDAYLSGQKPPAKPGAAGEEPAIVGRLREHCAKPWPGITTYYFSPDERRELLAWLDRPAPAAKEAGELQAAVKLAEQREREARRTAEEWRHEANDNADACERNRQERERQRRRAGKAEEERDRLRARVAELEADLSGTRAALRDRTEELREERGEADGSNSAHGEAPNPPRTPPLNK